VGFDHAVNQPAVNMQIPVYQCPSTPGDRKMATYNRFCPGSETIPGHTAQATDYMHPRVIMDYDGKSFGVGVLEDSGVTGTFKAIRPSDILDGLSNTIFMLESAVHPVNYILNRPNPSPPPYFGWYGEWPDDVGTFIVAYTADGTTPSFVHPSAGSYPTARGSRIINCNNNQAPYSFHPGGINVNLCDGSVRFLAESIEGKTFWSLCARDDGNVVGQF
jgi:prepilin-type processing-associated H-X9-DG protein